MASSPKAFHRAAFGSFATDSFISIVRGVKAAGAGDGLMAKSRASKPRLTVDNAWSRSAKPLRKAKWPSVTVVPSSGLTTDRFDSRSVPVMPPNMPWSLGSNSPLVGATPLAAACSDSF